MTRESFVLRQYGAAYRSAPVDVPAASPEAFVVRHCVDLRVYVSARRLRTLLRSTRRGKRPTQADLAALIPE